MKFLVSVFTSFSHSTRSSKESLSYSLNPTYAATPEMMLRSSSPFEITGPGEDDTQEPIMSSHTSLLHSSSPHTAMVLEDNMDDVDVIQYESPPEGGPMRTISAAEQCKQIPFVFSSLSESSILVQSEPLSPSVASVIPQKPLGSNVVHTDITDVSTLSQKGKRTLKGKGKRSRPPSKGPSAESSTETHSKPAKRQRVSSAPSGSTLEYVCFVSMFSCHH